MPKVRRTKIIIEETSREETSTTRVFVNGEKYQEIDFTDDNKKKKSTSKKITKKKTNKSSTKAKSKTSAKKESSTKAPKSKSNTKKKTSASKSKKKTSTKASTKKKDTDVKKEEAKEITQLENKDKATTQEVIELHLVSEDKDKNNEENNGDSEVKVEKELSSAENLNENNENDGGKVDSINDKESENKEPDNNELKESVNNKSVDTNNIPILLNDNSLAPLDSSNNKETIDNPEIIDGTRKTENEVKVKDQNLDTLEAEIVEKEKLDNKKEQEKKETEESKVTQKEENAKSSKDKSATIKENKEETSTKANAENEKDTSTSNEIKENQGEEKLQEKSNDNVTYTYVAQEENIKENDDSFKSKLKETFFSKKGLIIGGLILVVLIAILVPVSINLSNKEEENDNRIEINESDILKEKFISAGNFFDRLTSLEFSFRDYRSKTSTLTTELTYSCKDDIYSFNLTSNVYYPETQENAKTIDTLEYDLSQNNYLLTTTTIGDTLNVKDKEERCTKNQAKDYLKSVITNFYDNYLSYNALSIQCILDEVSKKEYNEINYYINSETNVYIIEDKSQSLRIIIDESGINTWTRYTTGSGICIPESSSDPAMLLYEINTNYELN